MITLVAILCQALLCTDVEVPTPMMVAGKCSDPQCSDSIPQGISLWDCQMHGEQLIIDWKAKAGPWRDWDVKAWKCVQGKYVSSQRAMYVPLPRKRPSKADDDNLSLWYRKLHDQMNDHKLPNWCAVSTGGGYDKEENMLLGYCKVRYL